MASKFCSLKTLRHQLPKKKLDTEIADQEGTLSPSTDRQSTEKCFEQWNRQLQCSSPLDSGSMKQVRNLLSCKVASVSVTESWPTRFGHSKVGVLPEWDMLFFLHGGDYGQGTAGISLHLGSNHNFNSEQGQSHSNS